MKKHILLFLAIFIATLSGFAQVSNNKKQTLPTELLKTETNKIFEKLIKIRRQIHENPELAGKEQQTQAVIKQYLFDLGLEVKTNDYGFGLVGILKGAKKGKNIAWRSDMDALSNDFPDKVEFKSKVQGVQHGCGHDVHIAIALGIAEVLAKNKKSLQGTAYFIFQPEEETFVGAKKMVEKGLLTDLKLDEIYGLHITALAVGQIMVKPNEVFAYQKGIRIALKNTLSKEEQTALIAKIRNALTRTNGNKPWEIQQIIDPKTGLASPATIFKDFLIIDQITNYTQNDTLFLQAELYETEATKVKNILPTVKQVIIEQNYASQLLSVSFFKENPTVVNDQRLTEIAIKTLTTNFGKEAVTLDYGQVPYFNDDFAYFQQKVAGVYFLLGASNFEKGIIAMNHAPNFEVDEECIRTGVSRFATLLFSRLVK